MGNTLTLDTAKTADERSAVIRANVAKLDGNKVPLHLVGTDTPTGEGLLSANQIKSNILLDLKTIVKGADNLRTGTKDKRAIEYNLEHISKRFGFGGVDSFFQALSIDPSRDTMHSLASMPEFEEGYRWIIPEIVREAVRLGVRKSPIYPNLIAGEENVTGMKVTMPSINMSDATPQRINEAETIQTGNVSFNQRDVKLHKVGTGLKVTDEVQKYVSLNILTLYLQDVGVKLGAGLDTLAIDTLINGDGSEDPNSAPVIGVKNPALGVQYVDLLYAWIQMGLLGKLPSGMISNIDPAMSILQLPEFKGANYQNRLVDVNIKTPIPQSQDYYVHGAMPTGNILGLIDKASALIKLNAEGLKVESERIAERQITGTYVTTTTGFAKLFRDAFLLIDGSLNITTNGLPVWMNALGAERVIMD